MINIKNTVIKKQNNFWNHCLFHPTDAIEDPWGKRILDQMAEDQAIQTVRIYTMFEDIVYLDEDGKLCYDFRVSDLRLDYMLEKGYGLLLAYGGMPDCIASTTEFKTTCAKNKTRYKGKMWNSAPPKDYALWEDICYEYTKHNVERYGIDVVSQWKCQCFNEPDTYMFFMSQLPPEAYEERLAEYCKLYEAFERAVRRVSEDIPIGGPALAEYLDFLGGLLDYVKERNLKMDFISVHNYGTHPGLINNNKRPITVANNVEKQKEFEQVIVDHGFGDTPIIIDEWGLATGGFINREECPGLMCRETEVFSAYFVKLIRAFIDAEFKMDSMMICLSGQHEMIEDFTGFRNFFTLNFIKKPIYNAYVLASKLGEELVSSEPDDKNISIIPTKTSNGGYAILLSYSSEHFEDNLPVLEQKVVFEEDISDKTVTVYCIDKEHTNPYRLYQKLDMGEPSNEELKVLREEGKLKPLYVQRGSEPLELHLTSNCVYLITCE